MRFLSPTWGSPAQGTCTRKTSLSSSVMHTCACWPEPLYQSVMIVSSGRGRGDLGEDLGWLWVSKAIRLCLADAHISKESSTTSACGIRGIPVSRVPCFLGSLWTGPQPPLQPESQIVYICPGNSSGLILHVHSLCNIVKPHYWIIPSADIHYI